MVANSNLIVNLLSGTILYFLYKFVKGDFSLLIHSDKRRWLLIDELIDFIFSLTFSLKNRKIRP